MKIKNVTTNKIAVAAGININSMWAYKYGHKDISKANLKTILKICEVIGCKVVDILDDQELIELINKANFK